MEPTTPPRPTVPASTNAPERPVVRSQAPVCPPAPRKARRVLTFDRINKQISLQARLIAAGYICPNAPERVVPTNQEKVEVDDIAKVLFE